MRKYTLREDKIIVKMFKKAVDEAHKGKPRDWARPHMIPNGACDKIGKVINRTANSVSSRIWNVLRYNPRSKPHI